MLNPEIVKALGVVMEITGTTWSERTFEAVAAELSAYDEQVMLKALHRCRLELRRTLTLGDVIDRVEDGFPGPEEAWNLVANLDESSTVVWTDEICQAFEGVRHNLDDRIAARMGFLEIYRPLLATARAQARQPRWAVSLGWDVIGRVGALVPAVEQGRLPLERAKALVPPEAWPEVWKIDRALPPHDAVDVRQGMAEISAALGRQLSAKPEDREPADEGYFERLRAGIAAAQPQEPAQQGQEGP